MDTKLNRLKEQLKFEEGLRLKKYQCSAGRFTIGYGHNLDAMPTYRGLKIPDKITADFAEKLLDNDIDITIGTLCERWPRIYEFDRARKEAFFNMAFQLGIAGFMGFERMRAAALTRNWALAHKEAMNSKWAKHDSPNRAERVAGQILTGQFYEVPQ